MKLKHLLFTLAVFCSRLFGQVDFTAPGASLVTQYGYSGSNVTYVCYAKASQPPTVFPVAGAATLTNVVVSANVGTITFSSTSYLWQGQQIIIAGSTTSTALNGTYIVTGVSGSTATIATSGVGNGTYNDSTMTITTAGPMLNSAVWAILRYIYSGSNVIGTYWGGGSVTYIPTNLMCSNGANY